MTFPKRARLDAAQKQHILSDWTASGLGARRFGAQVGVSAASLYRWRQLAEAGPRGAGRLVQVMIEPPPEPLRGGGDAAAVEVMTVGGVRLRWSRVPSAEYLAGFVRALSDSGDGQEEAR